MDYNSGVGGRTIAMFLLVMGISAAAAVPYFGSLGQSSADDESPPPAETAKAEEPEMKPDAAKPAKTARRAPRKSTPTRWSEGVTTSGSGTSGTASPPPRTPAYVSQPTPRKQTYIEVQGYRDPNGGITFTAKRVEK